jgi:drug/metabolite transporter (DMT)-like permease
VTERSRRRTGVVCLIVVVLAWGLTWPVNKVILASLSPLWAVVLRSALASAALLAVSLATGRLAVPPRQDLPVLLSITLLHMVGFNLLASWGLQAVPTGRSVVLAYTTPLWVTPASVMFLHERLTRGRAVGVVMGLAGLVTLFNPLAFDWRDADAVRGNLAILAAAGLWAASIVHIRAHRWRSTPFALVPWETLLATVVLAPIALGASGVPQVDWDVRLVLMLLYLGLVGTAVAYWAVAMASRELPAVTTSLGLLATPVVSAVTAALWLREPIGPSLIAAIALILGGVAVGTAADRSSRR